MQLFSDIQTLRAHVQHWRLGGHIIALVPTMGALHAGHMALIEMAKKCVDKVIVSIFVNPTQFGPNEDYSIYPRALEADAELCRQNGVNAIWAPDVATMYPDGFVSRIEVGAMAELWCGKYRPGHFSGVATVVAKLLMQVQPDMAVFGEKDFQQLQIIRRMVTDLNIPVSIEGAPTVREADGLALSSRNRYLSAENRELAPLMHQTLQRTARDIRRGEDVKECLAFANDRLLKFGFDKVDYVAYVDRETLEPLSKIKTGGRLLAAAYIGKTRLIDNIEV